MRYYLTASPKTWWAIAPEVPGVAAEDVASRDAAIARCRARAVEETDAYRRLGYAFDVSAADEVIDWHMPWWLIPDALLPVSPRLLLAAVRRSDEVAAEVEGFLDTLAPEAWDRASADSWTIRRTLDHIAGGIGIGLRRLESWPLDPDAAQASAIVELVERVRTAPNDAVELVGSNQDLGRVRWTRRKVVRVTLAAQQAWRAHADRGDTELALPTTHPDADGDDQAPSVAELDRLLAGDAALRELAITRPRVRAIAIWYRYYRDRLIPWPSDERERWRTMHAEFRRRLLALDEADLALVRIAPSGQCDTVRMQLGLALSHVREHLDQMRATAGA